jgi:hypothetical protein
MAAGAQENDALGPGAVDGDETIDVFMVPEKRLDPAQVS